MKQTYLFILFCILTFVSFGQRPRKIYSLLSEKMYPEALHELNKFDSQKKYDKDDLILFEIAKSLLMIEKGVGLYNPIKSIQTFSNISIPPKYKEDIDIFLNKYQLDLNKISILINSELVVEAKLTNSIEAYSKALMFCSISHEFELQNLLERRTLNDAKESKSISKLNNFITNYSNSSFKIEAIDFRDSLVLLKTPYLYDSLLLFTKIYPNSKFTFNLNNQLADCLFDEVYKTNSKDAYERFFTLFPLDKRVDTLRKKILSLRYFESKIINKNQSIDLQHYSIQLIKNGIAKVFDYSNKENRYPREGLINLKKEINKVTFYEQISDFRYGVSIVSNNGLYGLINSEGEIILPLKFNNLEIDSQGLIKVMSNNLYGVYDTTASTVLSLKYDFLEVTKLGMIIVSINNLYGVYNQRGESIIPMIYESLVYVSNYGFFAKLNGLNGLFNEKGSLIIPIKHQYFASSIEEKNRIVSRNDNKWGVINRDGKIIIPFEVGSIDIIKSWSEYKNVLFVRYIENNKLKIIYNINGKIITKVSYELYNYHYFDYHNLIEVSNNEAYFGYIDTNGREVIPLKYACSECESVDNISLNQATTNNRFFYAHKKKLTVPVVVHTA